MRSLIAGAAGSGVTFAAVWIVGVFLVQRFFAEAEGEEKLAAMVVAIPVALVLFVVAPLLAGLAGGLISRSVTGLIGSELGIGVVGAVAVILSGGSNGNTTGLVTAAGVVALLVVAGHLTGVAIAPRALPA
jgi:hypothetical protein